MILFINFCIIAAMFVLQAYRIRDLRRDYDGIRDDYNTIKADLDLSEQVNFEQLNDLATEIERLKANIQRLGEERS